MKRNFLLLLLLTLLPLAGWADLVFKAGSNATADSHTITSDEEVSLTTTKPFAEVTAWNTAAITYYTVSGNRNSYDENQIAAGALSDYSFTLLYKETEGEEFAVDNTTQIADGVIYITKPGFYQLSLSYWSNIENRNSLTDWFNYYLIDEVTLTSNVIKVVKQPEAITSDIELEITPVDGKEFFYQSPKEAFTVDISWFTTNKDYVNADVTGTKKAIAEMLEVNEVEMLTTTSVGTKEYSLRLKAEYVGEGKNTLPIPGYEEEGYKYIIMPSHWGRINIVQGQNWIYGEKQGEAYKFRVAQNLVYNGKNQDLVVGDEDAWARYAGENDKGIDFITIYAEDYPNLFEKDEEDNPIGFINPAEFDPDAFAATHENFPYVWNTTIPAKQHAGDYYIYAKAKDGASNFKGGTTLWRGTATIAKANPTFAGEVTNVIDPSWIRTTDDAIGNWRGLWKEIQPNKNDGLSSYQVQLPPFDEDGKPAYFEKLTELKNIKNEVTVTYWVQSGGTKTTVDGKDVYSFDDAGTPTIISASADIPYGISRIIAQFEGSDDWNGVSKDVSEVYTVFEVKYPEVSVQTLVKDHETATYAYGVDVFAPDYKDYSVGDPVWTPEGYTNTYTKANPITYKYYKKVFDSEDGYVEAQKDEDGFYPTGTYYVFAEGEYDAADLNPAAKNFWNTNVKVKVLPAIVTIAQGDIFATIEDQKLVYGQTLPLYVKYFDGALNPGSAEVDEFNATLRKTGFKAKNTVTGEEFDLTAVTYNTYPFGPFGPQVEEVETSILPVGTYNVTAKLYGPNDDIKILLNKDAVWTIVPKDINNEKDFNDPRVSGFNRFRLTMKYAAKQLVPGRNELSNRFFYRDNALVYGEDFQVINPGENINVADGGTFTVEGIGNYCGQKELSFDISKATIWVFAELPKDDNGDEIDYTWKVGTPEDEFYYKVDWEGKKLVPVIEDGVEKQIPTGIKYQLHAFENDRPLVNPEIVNADGFKALRARRCVGIKVGYNDPGVETYSIDDEEAANYNFVFDQVPLNIVKGSIVLKLADQSKVYAGSNKPNLDVELTDVFELANGEELIPQLAVNWSEVIEYNKAATTLTDSRKAEPVYLGKQNGKDWWVDRWPAGVYTITADVNLAEAFKATNYDVTIEGKNAEGKYTSNLVIERKPVTVTAINKNVTFDQTRASDFFTGMEAVNYDNVEVVPGLFYPVDRDVLGDVVKSLTIVKPVKAGNEGNVISVEVNPLCKNYAPTPIDGMMYVAPSEFLALTSDLDVYWTDQYGDYTDGKVAPGFPYGKDLPAGAKPVVKVYGDKAIIEANDGVPFEYVSLQLKPNTLINGELIQPAYSEWKAGEWHAMVLPFAATVGDIASQFGYAIINVVDKEATEAAGPNDVHFKLQEITETIPANTPFCIKSQFDFDYNSTLYFGEHKSALGATYPIIIEYAERPYVIADDVRGYIFEGIYDQKVVDNSTPYILFLGPNSRWKKITSAGYKYTMQPYTGFVNLGEVNATRELNFFFEEEDGSTTAIKAVDFMNGNQNNGDLYNVQGMKVQGAAQRGIYIQNGKKFVK